MTTPPIRILRRSSRAADIALWLPSFVVTGRRRSYPATAIMPRRQIGRRSPGQIRLMLLHPRLVGGNRQGILDGIMQPGMPLRRHPGRLDLALIKHPAALTSAADRLSLRVIAIAVLIGPDQNAPGPREKKGA